MLIFCSPFNFFSFFFLFADRRWGHLCYDRRPRVVRINCSSLACVSFLKSKNFFFFGLVHCRLPANQVGMIIDKGADFPRDMDATLRTYGESMWFFREQPDAATTRALNTYTGDHREYVCPKMCTRVLTTPISHRSHPRCKNLTPLKLPISHPQDAYNTP